MAREKETCPECGTSSGTYSYTGRCPNGCQGDKPDVVGPNRLRNEIIYAIEREWRVFGGIGTRLPGTEGVDIEEIVDLALREVADWLYEHSDDDLSTWDLAEKVKAMIETEQE